MTAKELLYSFKMLVQTITKSRGHEAHRPVPIVKSACREGHERDTTLHTHDARPSNTFTITNHNEKDIREDKSTTKLFPPPASKVSGHHCVQLFSVDFAGSSWLYRAWDLQTVLLAEMDS